MTDRGLLRLSATLLIIGVLLTVVAGVFHNADEAGIPANEHPAVFAAYAASGNWTAVHLGQFVGTAILPGGNDRTVLCPQPLGGSTACWVGFFGAVSAGVTIGLYGVLQAVDGVALKQAVDAWANAPAADKATRFASAEAIRWLEWGTRSYENLVFGLALVLFAVTIVWTARVPRPIGYLMGLSGLAWLVVGWVVGVEGFSPAGALPSIAGQVLLFIWTIWLAIAAWRMREPAQAGPR